MAAFSQACAHFVKQFEGREWAGTHAGGIGFNDTQKRPIPAICGPTPAPVEAAPAKQLDEVTNG